MAYKFEIYKDKAGEYRVRFTQNSRVMWSSEGYSNKASALSLIETVKKNVPASTVEDSDSVASDLVRRINNANVPAADRIVRLDHNSTGFSDFTGAVKQLEQAIRSANYVGELSPDDLEVARAELLQLKRGHEGKWIRPAHIWQVAKSTLLWIFNKSADAAFGLLALAALEALAKLLGVAL